MYSATILSIPLLPHYLMLAIVVIVIHWIWVFGIKKGKPTASAKGYQTGGNSKNFSQLWDTQEESSIISRPSLAEEFVINNLPLGSQEPSEDVSLKNTVIDPHSVVEEDTRPHLLLSEAQAVFDMISALRELSEGKLDADSLKTLQEIAAITIATDKLYPNMMDEITDILTSPTVDAKNIPFIL